MVIKFLDCLWGIDGTFLHKNFIIYAYVIKINECLVAKNLLTNVMNIRMLQNLFMP